MPYDHWMTPPKVLSLVRQCGDIDLDPASNLVAQEYVKAAHFCVDPYTTEFDGYGVCPPDNCTFDGLTFSWYGNVFCNPPYSRGNIDAFVDKAIAELPNVDQTFFLVNSATDTAWYHKLVENFHFTALWRGRMKFWKIDIDAGVAYDKWEGEKSKQIGRGKVGNSPRYLNTLFYHGSAVKRLRFYEVFSPHATILTTQRGKS